MSPMDFAIAIFATAVLALFLWWRQIVGRLQRMDQRTNTPTAPITATYPARWIEVNGFRYVLDKCGCGKPKGSAEGCCGCGR